MNKIVKGLMIAGTLGASLMAFTRTADAKDKDGNIVIVIDPDMEERIPVLLQQPVQRKANVIMQ